MTVKKSRKTLDKMLEKIKPFLPKKNNFKPASTAGKWKLGKDLLS